MDVRLILMVGDTSHLRTCAAFTRRADIDVPARRGDIFHCPVGDGLGVAATVADTRVGGDSAVLLLFSEVPLDGPVVEVLYQDPLWVETPVACGLRGDAVGVFVDGDDWLQVEQWPAADMHALQSMVELGLIDRFPSVQVPGVSMDSGWTDEPLEIAEVVPIRSR